MTEVMDESYMRAELERRLVAFEAAGATNLSYFQEPKTRGVDLTRDPLYVIWDGDPNYGYIVRYALAVWNVVGILNKPYGHDFYGMKFSGEAEFRDATRAHPRLAALMLLDNKVAMIGLCDNFGVPGVEVALANQVAGVDRLAEACAPHVRGNLSILDHLADELSRRTLIATQLYRLSREPKWLSAVMRPSEEMYFRPGLFSLGTDTVFVDGGASLGDTVEGFVAITGGRYRHIHAIEPSPLGAGLMRRAFAGNPRISVHQIGLAAEAAVIGFSDSVDVHGAINGTADPGARETVQIDALDNLGLGQVDFIKLDIEGFEVPALRGARETIRHWRPAMAICAYHKPDDFLTIWSAIRDIHPSYRCYLRHYAPSEGDSVFYFV